MVPSSSLMSPASNPPKWVPRSSGLPRYTIRESYLSAMSGSMLPSRQETSCACWNNTQISTAPNLRISAVSKVEEYNAAIRTMSRGDALGGMKQLDALGWVQEAEGQYIQQAADAYFAATADGTHLDRCIAISPTWEENHRFTDAIREGLKHRGLIGRRKSHHNP